MTRHLPSHCHRNLLASLLWVASGLGWTAEPQPATPAAPAAQVPATRSVEATPPLPPLPDALKGHVPPGGSVSLLLSSTTLSAAQNEAWAAQLASDLDLAARVVVKLALQSPKKSVALREAILKKLPAGASLVDPGTMGIKSPAWRGASPDAKKVTLGRQPESDGSPGLSPLKVPSLAPTRDAPAKLKVYLADMETSLLNSARRREDDANLRARAAQMAILWDYVAGLSFYDPAAFTPSVLRLHAALNPLRLSGHWGWSLPEADIRSGFQYQFGNTYGGPVFRWALGQGDPERLPPFLEGCPDLFQKPWKPEMARLPAYQAFVKCPPEDILTWLTHRARVVDEPEPASLANLYAGLPVVTARNRAKLLEQWRTEARNWLAGSLHSTRESFQTHSSDRLRERLRLMPPLPVQVVAGWRTVVDGRGPVSLREVKAALDTARKLIVGNKAPEGVALACLAMNAFGSREFVEYQSFVFAEFLEQVQVQVFSVLKSPEDLAQVQAHLALLCVRHHQITPYDHAKVLKRLRLLTGPAPQSPLTRLCLASLGAEDPLTPLPVSETPDLYSPSSSATQFLLTGAWLQGDTASLATGSTP